MPRPADHRLCSRTTRWPCATARGAGVPALLPGQGRIRRCPGKGEDAARKAHWPSWPSARLLYPALKAAEALDATVVNMRWAKPLDEALLLQVAAQREALVTLEEGAVMGGAGSAVRGAERGGILRPVLQLGLPDRSSNMGSGRLLAMQGLDAAGIEFARFCASATGVNGPPGLKVVG